MKISVLRKLLLFTTFSATLSSAYSPGVNAQIGDFGPNPYPPKFDYDEVSASKKPEPAKYYYDVGLKQQNSGEYEKAINSFKSALQMEEIQTSDTNNSDSKQTIKQKLENDGKKKQK